MPSHGAEIDAVLEQLAGELELSIDSNARSRTLRTLRHSRAGARTRLALAVLAALVAVMLAGQQAISTFGSTERGRAFVGWVTDLVCTVTSTLPPRN